MEILGFLIGFVVVWVLGSFILSAAWASESPTDDYPIEFLWWPIWLLTVGLMRVFKSMKRAISEEWYR
jgi:hypothetical protein